MSKKRNLQVVLEDIIEEINRINNFTQGIGGVGILRKMRSSFMRYQNPLRT